MERRGGAFGRVTCARWRALASVAAAAAAVAGCGQGSNAGDAAADGSEGDGADAELRGAELQNVKRFGQRLYNEHCLACHQASGDGVPNMQPSLVSSPLVLGEAEPLIELTLRGVGSGEGALEPSGEWAAVMTGYDFLSDREIAAVLTYVRSAWGNDAPPVSADDVARVRRASGSVDEGGSAAGEGGAGQ